MKGGGKFKIQVSVCNPFKYVSWFLRFRAQKVNELSNKGQWECWKTYVKNNNEQINNEDNLEEKWFYLSFSLFSWFLFDEANNCYHSILPINFCLYHSFMNFFRGYQGFQPVVLICSLTWASPDGSVGKEFACNAGVTGDMGSTPGSGQFSGGGNGNPFQYSCLENSVDRVASQTVFQRVPKSWTWLGD